MYLEDILFNALYTSMTQCICLIMETVGMCAFLRRFTYNVNKPQMPGLQFFHGTHPSFALMWAIMKMRFNEPMGSCHFHIGLIATVIHVLKKKIKASRDVNVTCYILYML